MYSPETRSSSQLPVALFLLALGAPLGVMTAHAADAGASTPKAAPQKTAPSSSDLIKFSEAGRETIDAVRKARIDIFNGDPKGSMAALTRAKTQLAAAEKDAPTFKVNANKSSAGNQAGKKQVTAKAVPVSGELVLADNFAPSPEKQKAIAKANEHFKKGQHQQAMEALRQGQISVNYISEWMPLASTSKNLDQAIKLEQAGKYYQANLALKAIEDSLVVESVMLPASTPKATKTAKGAPPTAAK
jgi:hypothetical protein